MRDRPVRLVVTTLLLASLLSAAFFFWHLDQRAATAAARAGDASARQTPRITRMSDTISGIGTAQQGYVAPGQLDEPWFERESTLARELSRDIQQARESLRSPEAAAVLQQLTASVATLTAADARTRENLQLGREMMASDVIFSDGRNLLDAMTASLRQLQAAEHDHLRAELSLLSHQRWLTFGAVAVLWTAGLLLLVARSAGSAAPRAPVRDRAESARTIPSPPRSQPRAGADLAAIASVCTDLSRITTTAALPGLLGRAAGALDATGLILWISAGEQLFPVMAHGYSEEMLARMGPIARDAENAAATAWRSERLTVVPASSTGGPGAIVTPLFGLHSCIGVLSAELRQGEDSATVQAVATIIAAQLSTVVPAWPAGNLTPAAESASRSAARSA
jgi:hypothetical protein